MSVRARILAIRITELVHKHPKTAQSIGVEAALVRSEERSTIDQKPTEKSGNSNYVVL